MVNPADLADVLTLGQIAERLKTSTHKVKYAVERHGIRPAGRIGILRVWSTEALHEIQSALDEIATKHKNAPTQAEPAGDSTDRNDSGL